MAIDVLDVLRAKKMSPMEDYFERIYLRYPMSFYLSPYDIECLRKIATSVKLSGKIREKYKMIDDIMKARGFKRFGAGTNRVVYSYYEDTSFLVKIAVDRVGMQDNPMEYRNQFFLKPHVAKMFCISPCGTVGFAERVIPIKNIGEFKEIASDVFDILVTKFLGKYVVEDVGTKYFMNWGIRVGHGPVLLDYPYVYKLDGKKLYCNEFLPDFNCICEGEIDYNSGFNHLVCSRCGKIYLAVDLRDDTPDNKKIIAKGGYSMKVQLVRGNNVVYDPIQMDDTITREKPTKKKSGNESIVAVLQGGNADIPSTSTKTDVENYNDDVQQMPDVEQTAESDTEVIDVVNEQLDECDASISTKESHMDNEESNANNRINDPDEEALEPDTDKLAGESSDDTNDDGIKYVNTPTGMRAQGPDGKFISMKNISKRDRKHAKTAFIPAAK